MPGIQEGGALGDDTSDGAVWARNGVALVTLPSRSEISSVVGLKVDKAARCCTAGPLALLLLSELDMTSPKSIAH